MASKAQAGILRYAAVVAGCLAIGLTAGWTPLAQQIDNNAYDRMTAAARSASAPDTESSGSVVVAIDEKTLEARGGPRAIRPILAEALDKIAAAKPKLVAIDVLLHDAGDPVEDARLEASLRATPNLILPCELVDGRWEDPLDRFKPLAAALGHVEREENRYDGVTSRIPLELTIPGSRRWAMSLEAFRIQRAQPIVESPEDVQVGSTIIPAPRVADRRNMRIRYLAPGIESVSVLDAGLHPELIRDKAVFLGVTALSMARDRVVTPYGEYVAGVAINAHAFETLVRGRFLTSARDLSVVLICLGLAAGAGLIFGLLSGWPAYLLAVVLLGSAHFLPVLFFRHDVVLPYFSPVAVAWLSVVGAASYQHFFVRRQLRRSESERSRYQQAIHWAAHEMRTPLTAIQGSSEIMSRYQLPEDKRHQLSDMINSESKRLSRIIQTFLDVERLADGQMELKRELFAAGDVIDACMKRVAPLAERKQIEMSLASSSDAPLLGDRELMEYAVYNLLTNAVKYSPAGTHVRVSSELRGGELRLAVQDEGIGMDAKEIKNIFKKFYRTKRAEASGEVGTGIGLSIVEQIVGHHHGRVDVSSEPGKGSCFTIVMKTHAEAADRRG